MKAKNEALTGGRPVAGSPRTPPGARRQRAPWGSVSRELVVTTALRLVREQGYEMLTVRRLAAEMGVAPMTIYHHVQSKDDLLDEVVDRMLAGVWRPVARLDKGWRPWVAEAAERFRQFLVDEPAALHVYLTHPVVSAEAQARMGEMLIALRRSGLDEGAVRRAYAAIHTYTIGFAALQASRAGWEPKPGTGPVALQLAAYTTARQFSEGLGYILEGIERRGSSVAHLRAGAGKDQPPSSGGRRSTADAFVGQRRAHSRRGLGSQP